MASIRQAAQDVLDEARDGIAWIAVWREGKGWGSVAIWPEYDDDTNRFAFNRCRELKWAQDIVKLDPSAILVNPYYHNLGPVEVERLTRDQLADALRWQYDMGLALLSEALENCAQ